MMRLAIVLLLSTTAPLFAGNDDHITGSGGTTAVNSGGVNHEYKNGIWKQYGPDGSGNSGRGNSALDLNVSGPGYGTQSAPGPSLPTMQGQRKPKSTLAQKFTLKSRSQPEATPHR